MNIVFMGTPDFSLPSLKILLESKHTVLAVVTQPDKVRGRGQKLSFTPVKEFAVEYNFSVYQPEKLKGNAEFVEQMKSLKPDLFVVGAFRILPKEVFEIPKFGSFNLHGSYLPKYRGAAPIQWALINGETETGLTTLFIQDAPLQPGDYFRQLANSLGGMDFVLLALKSLAFGFIIAIVTCYHGLAQPLRLEEVSQATVRAVPQSVVACVLIDALFIIIYLAS